MEEKLAGGTGGHGGVSEYSESSYPDLTHTRSKRNLRSTSNHATGTLLSTGNFVSKSSRSGGTGTPASVAGSSGAGPARRGLGSTGRSTDPTTAAALDAASRSSTANGDKMASSLRMGAAISSKNIGFKVRRLHAQCMHERYSSVWMWKAGCWPHLCALAVGAAALSMQRVVICWLLKRRKCCGVRAMHTHAWAVVWRVVRIGQCSV